MGRAAYGKVGGRRGSGAAWQWIVIGVTLGLGCSAVMVLSLLTFGVLNLGGSDDPEPTEVALEDATDVLQPEVTVDVQATVDAAIAATQAALPTPTVQVQFVAPSATPSTDLPADEPEDENGSEDLDTSSLGLPEPEETEEQPSNSVPDSTAADTGDSLARPQQTQGLTESQIPAQLEPLMSDTVQIPGGTFLMGTTPQEVGVAVRECVDLDEGNCLAAYGEDSYPSHSVTLDTFFMEETEVTNQQYVNFLNYLGPNSHRNGCFGNPCVETRSQNEGSPITFDSQNYDIAPIANNLPVIAVTWYGARAYCEAIGRRLPTEAEWERAARGDQGFIYPWGNERDLTRARTSRPRDGVGPVEVGSFAIGASPYGVLDMAGNVAEWNADWYQENWYSQPDASGLNPTGPLAGTDRVIRGGSWDALPFFARTVHRQHLRPEESRLWLGFRCAEDFEEADAASPTGLDPSTLDFDEDTEAALPEDESIDAAPTIPPVSLPPTNPEVPAVPPGG